MIKAYSGLLYQGFGLLWGKKKINILWNMDVKEEIQNIMNREDRMTMPSLLVV